MIFLNNSYYYRNINIIIYWIYNFQLKLFSYYNYFKKIYLIILSLIYFNVK